MTKSTITLTLQPGKKDYFIHQVLPILSDCLFSYENHLAVQLWESSLTDDSLILFFQWTDQKFQEEFLESDCFMTFWQETHKIVLISPAQSLLTKISIENSPFREIETKAFEKKVTSIHLKPGKEKDFLKKILPNHIEFLNKYQNYVHIDLWKEDSHPGHYHFLGEWFDHEKEKEYLNSNEFFLFWSEVNNLFERSPTSFYIKRLFISKIPMFAK